MKLVVAGGRSQELTAADLAKLDAIHATQRVTELVSGGAAEVWAASLGIQVRRFQADWRRYRRGAGPIRNREMAAYADAVAVFPGGSGTRNMRAEAHRAGKPVFDFMGETGTAAGA